MVEYHAAKEPKRNIRPLRRESPGLEEMYAGESAGIEEMEDCGCPSVEEIRGRALCKRPPPLPPLPPEDTASTSNADSEELVSARQASSISLGSSSSHLEELISSVPTSTEDTETEESDDENYLQELDDFRSELEMVEAERTSSEGPLEKEFDRATAGWFEHQRQKHEFLVLVFYRGSW